ncbi:hypothetical protein CHLNCDRAFT_138284 [Chlorella variabilis]|uniref:AB hydrolase-1 domain-containing protein n=1 Tax=Chlorella variabilis TaxID=554065 RepID=E1ZMQ2_CHLVA|nr:hypothetical protein CHLNCDRAFT_138284 [Chlorella variabilis]EFN52838.1 hypothetical protein CHLNCDRAFT_138284 [Chlorella variabilis]|eukprot:XP_005844940.1 hypothetical protein CHLNCDRAFT_138284 [Chlorella variabilis]
MACKRFGVLLVLLAAHLALVQGQNCDYTGPGLDDELAALGLSTDPNATWTGPLQTAQVGDVSFPYYIFGAEDSSGPTVVMITGFGTTMAEWGPVLPQLLAKSMADSIMGLLRDAGVATEDAKPVLLGWSMGGMVALSMAQQYGSELAGLVLADTAQAPAAAAAAAAAALSLPSPMHPGPCH